MGRPRKFHEAQRTNITIRATSADRAALKAFAAQRGETMTDILTAFIRTATKNAPVPQAGKQSGTDAPKHNEGRN
jgi:hypothetical protein